MKLILLVALMFFSVQSYANGIVGFKNGNDLEITNLYGTVTFHCQKGMSNYTQHHSCNGYITNPGTHDYLVSNAHIDADKVKLTAVREDGSTQNKSVGFDSEKSESKSRINLTIRTLLQRPLLKEGNNTINYSFEKKKKTVLKGSFNATVTTVADRQCRHRTVFTQNSSYCDSYASGCDYYYYLENNCQYN